jgi:hypothetical protein
MFFQLSLLIFPLGSFIECHITFSTHLFICHYSSAYSYLSIALSGASASVQFRSPWLSSAVYLISIVMPFPDQRQIHKFQNDVSKTSDLAPKTIEMLNFYMCPPPLFGNSGSATAEQHSYFHTCKQHNYF